MREEAGGNVNQNDTIDIVNLNRFATLVKIQINYVSVYIYLMELKLVSMCELVTRVKVKVRKKE